MKKPTLKLLMLLAGIVAYDFLFWKNFLGINALLFTLLLIVYFFLPEPSSLKNKKILVTAGGTLLAAILVVTHNSITSIVVLLTSFTVLTGFYLQPQLRSAFAAL